MRFPAVKKKLIEKDALINSKCIVFTYYYFCNIICEWLLCNQTSDDYIIKQSLTFEVVDMGFYIAS